MALLAVAGMAFGQNPEEQQPAEETTAQKEQVSQEEREAPVESGSSEEEGSLEKEDAFHKKLDEVVVNGESAWVEGNKYIFLPDRRAKRQASNMAEMIELMGTSVLESRKGSITTSDGQPVEIYINGVKADDMDQSTFWAMNALRVEYMPVTDDPRFNGSRNVVNFIMKEYVAGGLTNIEAFTHLPGWQSYDASSKLVYKKMSYNALVKGSHTYDHFTHSESRESFEDIWYDGEHHDLVEKVEENRSKSKSNAIYGGLNARYRNDKWTITHAASIQWNQNPGSSTFGTLSYTPEIISGNRAWAEYSSRSLTPGISGNYIFIPGGGWGFYGEWFFNHTHNNNSSRNCEGEENMIFNNSKENEYSGGLFLHVVKSLGTKHSLQLSLGGNMRHADIDYEGDVSSHQKVGSTYGTLLANWYFKPIDKFYLTLTPTLVWQRRKVNDSYNTTQFLPSLRFYIAYNFNRKHNINLHADLSQNVPGSSTMNDLILRQTELKWIEGNPYIKSSLRSWLGAGYYARPTNWLNSELSFNYNLSGKTQVLKYRSGGPEYDGVIGQYGNAHTFSETGVFCRLNFKLFDSNFQIEPYGSYDYQRVRNLNSVNSTRYSILLRYFFGDFRANISFDSSQRSLINGGMEIMKEPASSELTLYYGNGNLTAHVSVYSPLRKYAKATSTLINGPYSSQTISWERALKVSVYLSYTFDYGKKVDPSIDIQENDLRSTSVLGK